MGWFLKFLNSSIGKKFIMAVKGSFLLIHLVGNITLFFGPNAFSTYVSALDTIKPLIRVIEVVLLATFILHIFNGVRLWIENKRARGVTYKVNGSSENSTVFSRTMFVTGSIIFIFLVLHLGTFFWRFNIHYPENLEPHQYFNIVLGFLQMPWYSILYIIAVSLLGFHLNHGFQSAFQTFGWNHNKYTPIIKKLGTIYAIIMALGFASMPLYFLLGGGN
jgi:succinate dehydrogenase / fumarate reductase cytochrome b subunit